MDALFQIKRVALSDTIYSEVRDNMQRAQEMGDWRWYGDMCVEAYSLLVDAGVLAECQPISVTRYPQLLKHCHLDAQIEENDE
jgi:hypothetical protein